MAAKMTVKAALTRAFKTVPKNGSEQEVKQWYSLFVELGQTAGNTSRRKNPPGC
jgi:hypothetical protein